MRIGYGCIDSLLRCPIVSLIKLLRLLVVSRVHLSMQHPSGVKSLRD